MSGRNVVPMLLLLLAARPSLAADDARVLAKLPSAAEAALREEMRANMLHLAEVINLTVAGKLKEAGELAERELGLTAMGKNRSLPLEARPGRHMPDAMHTIGIDGHKAASAFALISATGDRDKTLAALPSLSGACVGCHYAYRIR